MSDRTVVTLDSGERTEFQTGARRDSDKDAARFDLIPLQILDLLQQSYGGAPLKVKRSLPPITFDMQVQDPEHGLIPEEFLNRVQALLERGAVKYGPGNWTKGIPLNVTAWHLFQHWMQWLAGDTSEDHIAAVAVNALFILWTEIAVSDGQLPRELADAGPMSYQDGS
jgi:hypothetical protein